MKPSHLIFLFIAIFITLLADGLEAGLVNIALAPGAIPVVGALLAGVTAPIGIAIGLVVSWCINVTMGSMLLLFLVLNGMYHPKWGTAGFIGAFIPGLNALPFLVGMVIAGIMHDIAQEGGALGTVAKVAENLNDVYETGASPLSKAKAATGVVWSARKVPSGGEEARQERASSIPQTKNFDGINPYVQKAA